MNRREHTRSGALVITVICLSAWLGGCWYLSSKAMPEASIYESPVFATSYEARKHVGTPLPDEAVKIQLASYREWIAAEDYLRFEAPAEVCLNHAKLIMPKQNFLPGGSSRASWLTPFPQSSHFKDLSWFDLGAAKNTVSATEGHTSVFVDLDRGVFYYHFTD